MSDVLPNAIGPYTPKKLIATGAQAQVFRAEGPEGVAALKVARTERSKEALAREAEVLLLGGHPALVKLLGRSEDGSWLAVEFVEGTSLYRFAKKASLDEIIDVGKQLADVVGFLHEHKVIHGDLKPSNVMVDNNGNCRLLDLGLATILGEERKSFRGTLGYAAPELLQNRPPNPATDAYGLGATLYACITGRPPFDAPDPAALTYLPLVSLPEPPSSSRSDLTRLLNHLILTLLARNPGRRLADMEKIKATLEKSRTGSLARAVLGMKEERDALRRAVIGAADAEARVVIVYGPPGSGRRTLISETVEAARREGLPYAKGVEMSKALPVIKKARSAPVFVLRDGQSGAREVCKTVLENGLAALMLVHADRPIPELARAGAIQITPTPLGLRDTNRLVTAKGGDSTVADTIWRDSMGLPISVMGGIRRWQRDEGESVKSDLPSTSAEIYKRLQKGPREVSALAKELSMGQHTLLDHCEVLFAEGLVTSTDDGSELKTV